MGHLLHTLLALGALALAEAGYESGLRMPWLAPALVGLPVALAVLARERALAGRWHAAARLDLLLGASGPIAQFAAACGLGWSASVEGWLGPGARLTEWPGPALLVALAPFVVVQAVAVGARARALEPPGPARRGLRDFLLRSLVGTLLPLAGFLVVNGLVGRSPVARAWLESSTAAGAAYTVALLGGMLLALPRLLRFAWAAEPLPPGPERASLEEAAARAGFRYRELLVWRTGGHVANAAIVGVLPRQRLVLMTDALLARLSLRELRAVFAHEMGHALRHHVPVFVAWGVGSFLLADRALAALAPDDEAAAGVAVVGAFLVWYASFGYLSRRFELDADLVSLETTRDPEALASALDRVAGAHARGRPSWRHFSVAQRVLFLRAAAADPAVGARLRRGLRRWTRVGAAAAVLAVGLEAAAVVGRFGNEAALVDLRLGRYAEARERLGALGDPDPGLTALAEAGAALGPGVDGEALVRLGREAWAAGDYGAAWARLELARLQGERDLDALIEALELLADGRGEAARALFEREAPGWRDGEPSPEPADGAAR